MFHLMLQKILHKKWMVASLLIGNILLIAISVSHPMYQEASRKRMLTDGFSNYLETNNTYPMRITLTGRIRKNAGRSNTKKIREFAQNLSAEFGLPEKQRVCYHDLVSSIAKSTTVHDGANTELKISISAINDFANHSKIISGNMFSNTIGADGYIEAVMTQSTMVSLNLLVGEELTFQSLKFTNGEPVKVRVVGVFTNSDENDLYWVDTPDSYKLNLFIDPQLFSDCFLDTTAKQYQINEVWNIMPDYTAVRPEMVDHIIAVSDSMFDTYKSVYSEVTATEYSDILKNYQVQEKQITVTLSILQVPVIVLLCAFIFMISRQMLEMEDNEIALLKSRGASKYQVVWLYFLQSAFLAIISFIIGLPLGNLMCRILGASSEFLKFVQRRALTVEYSKEVFLYGLLAVVVSMLMTLLPVFKRDKSSIVAVKRRRSREEKPIWQKLYLDFVCLGVSIYGLYNFSQQQDEMLVRVMSGKSLDPLLFLSSSLFIIGAGMVSLRIHSLMVKVIFKVGKRGWKPASYTSFLQLIRTRNKQAFIMLFLVLTVAFGMFNTTVARTILANAENNKGYTIGADIVMQEYWKNNASYAVNDPEVEVSFSEPDFGKYGQIEGMQAIAKVFRDDAVSFKVNKETKVDSMLMAIDTKDFGSVTDLKDGLLKYRYREYLNVLSKNSNGVLLSSNYRDKFGIKVGDKVTYSFTSPYYSGTVTANVYGFVDYWPSYSPTSRNVLADGNVEVVDNYLIIAHLSTIQEAVGILPYQIWINMDGKTDAFYNFTEANNVQLTMIQDATEQKAKIASEPLFQGTNGILTMSFITILLICSIGYVIYWTLSIKSRELLFGIFRAMGMSRNEIIHMLVNEQVFTGVFGILFGLVIGWIASRLYVPIIQIAYSAADRVLPLELITKTSDVVRLVVIIGIVFIICLAILINQVLRMKISQALKLGED